MAKDSENNANNKTLSPDESASNKSFVKKVKSRVSGLLPSSLSRWFGNTSSEVRYREDSDDEDDESFQIQPPAKRSKPNENTLPSSSSNYEINSTSKANENDILTNKTKLNNINHVENKLTFPEPIAGPSGYNPRRNLTKSKTSLNKQLYTAQHEVTNGDKYSDSGESVTSGYSSMNVGKDVVVENKKETVNDSFNKLKFSFNTGSRSNDRSLFSDRCSSPQALNSSLSTRQPSFNSSIFGSPNFVDRTLSSQRILNSPFYNGRTAYGGASAYGRTLMFGSSDQKSSTNRNSVQIKPINERTNAKGGNTTLSKTARRILDTLEQYTTPITDAKKIPNPSIRKKYLTANKPYPVRETKVPSNRELQVPTVPDLLKMKLKERLQDSTESVRQIASSSKSVLNREEYKISTLEPEDDKSMKRSNKMKNKINSVRQKNEPHRTIEEVKLPDIQLPISSLPKFDFTLPPIQSTKSTIAPTKSTETIKTSTSTLTMVEKETKTQKSVETNKTESTTVETCSKDNNSTESNKTESKKSEQTKVTEFKFSDPLIIAENLKSIRAINNFIFSEPTPTKPFASPIKEKVEIENTTPSKNNGECKNESSNSILKVLKNDTPANTNDLMAKFKPSNDTWECTVCLIRNVDTKNKCAACETPRPQNKVQNSKPPPAIGFGDKFKVADGQWSCKVCLIVNPADKAKCVACETPKEDKNPNVNVKDAKNIFGNALVKNTEAKPFGLFADISNAQKSKWECTSCLVRNNETDLKCVACTAPKPTTNGSLKTDKTPSNTWGDKFKASSDTWSCDSCMVRNKNDASKCIACQGPRPANIKPSSPGFGEKFKKNDQWECDSCMVRNPQDKDRCQCCDALKPGTPNPDIPKEKTSLSLFNFGIDTNAKTTTSGFTFGIKPSENKSETTTNATAPTTTTPFPVSSIFGQNAASTSSASTPTFSFGIKPSQAKAKEAPPIPSIIPNDDKKKEKEETISVTPQKEPTGSGFSFNPSQSTPQQTTEIKPAEAKPEEKNTGFTFNAPKSTEQTTSNTFGKDAPKLFSFGANAAPISTATTTPIFGANSTPATTTSFNSVTEPPKPITFGNSNPQPTPPTTTAPNLFSNAKPNLFSAAPVKTPATSAFGGDSKDEQPPAKMPLFSFGQANKPNSDPPKFGFGAVQPSSTSGAFSFGQSAPAQPNLSFNKPTEENGPSNSMIGSNSMPVFNFGTAANSTPKTGFNFGASQQSIPPPVTNTTAVPPVNNTGIFNFGAAANPAAPSTGGFNFNVGASTEFKPNFNFTAPGQTPTFSAQPNPGESKGRVIRRAIRRTHR